MGGEICGQVVLSLYEGGCLYRKKIVTIASRLVLLSERFGDNVGKPLRTMLFWLPLGDFSLCKGKSEGYGTSEKGIHWD